MVVRVFSHHENEDRNKHVESVWFPCLDEGSTPSSSTNRKKVYMDWLNFAAAVLLVIIGIAIYISKKKDEG